MVLKDSVTSISSLQRAPWRRSRAMSWYYSLLSTPIPFGPSPQNVLADLSCTRLRQLLYDFTLPRDHESRHGWMISTPLNERFIRHLLPWLDSYKCLWSFSPLFVCDGCNAAFEDVGVGYDDRFQGYRGDVLAACRTLEYARIEERGRGRLARNDNILRSIQDLDGAIRMPNCQIPTMQHTTRK